MQLNRKYIGVNGLDSHVLLSSRILKIIVTTPEKVFFKFELLAQICAI